jgi:pyridoxine kinase
MKEAARIIHGKGARHVFIKGGAKLKEAVEAGQPKAVDIFFDGKNFSILEEKLIKTVWNHGAGCTTSAAIVSGLARGWPILEAVIMAKRFITKSLKAGFALNQWVGPGNPTDWRKARIFGN